jgi:hypothetical protein
LHGTEVLANFCASSYLKKTHFTDLAPEAFCNQITSYAYITGPYEHVVVFSVRNNGISLYSELITLEPGQVANDLPSLVEKLLERKKFIRENLKEARFDIRQNIIFGWKGFLKKASCIMSMLMPVLVVILMENPMEAMAQLIIFRYSRISSESD